MTEGTGMTEGRYDRGDRNDRGAAGVLPRHSCESRNPERECGRKGSGITQTPG